MNKVFRVIAVVSFALLSVASYGQSSHDLKVYIIRHGEKPAEGDNLNCKGLNRSLQLPSVLYSKMGVPNFVYVPTLDMKGHTKHSRMFQTVTPFVSKYNLMVNSAHATTDYANLASDIKSQRGKVLVVWEHKALTDIVKALGVKEEMKWADDDFDSIWIVTIADGKATLSLDKEGLHPQDDCSF